MKINQRDISVTEEKRIVTGMVVSTDFIRQITDVYEKDYFTNKYLQIIAEWSISFFLEHEKAPYKHIQDIYESEAHRLKETEADLIKTVLKNLSEQYDEEAINVDYLKDTTEEYFRNRELEIHVNNIKALQEQGELQKAEGEIERFRKVSLALDESIYINPGDTETRDRLYQKRDEKEKHFFTLPGDLGKFIGNCKPGDVIGITAPAKRGKSFLLVDFFKQGVMSRKKVVHFSIEMTDTEMLSRVDKAFVPSLDSGAATVKFPVFDCLKNQTGECKNRESKVIILEDEEEEAAWHPDHVTCDKCRRNGRKDKFQMTTYLSEIERDGNDIFTMRKKMKKFNSRLDRYSRIVVRPKYSLTEDLIFQDLLILETRHNFIPDIILLDYIDILQINSTHDDYKLEDEKWKLLQKVAGRTKCMVATVTQANKEGYKAETLHTTDQAGFYGKGRHVNLMLGINQKPEEKKKGIYRIGILDSRAGHSIEGETCTVLQDLKTGQMHLDSYWEDSYRF